MIRSARQWVTDQAAEVVTAVADRVTGNAWALVVEIPATTIRIRVRLERLAQQRENR